MSERDPNLEVQLGFAGTAAATLTALSWFALDSARTLGVPDGAACSALLLSSGVSMALALDLALFLVLRTVWMAWAMAQQEDFAQVDDTDLRSWYRRGSGWFSDALGRFVGWCWLGVLLVVLEVGARVHAYGALVAIATTGLVLGFALWGPGSPRLTQLHRNWRWWVWDAWSVPGAPTGWRRIPNVVWASVTVGAFSIVAATYTMVPGLEVDPPLIHDHQEAWVKLQLASMRGDQTEVTGVLDGDVPLALYRLGDTYVARVPAALSPGPHTVTVHVVATFEDGGNYRFDATTSAVFLVLNEGTDVSK